MFFFLVEDLECLCLNIVFLYLSICWYIFFFYSCTFPFLPKSFFQHFSVMAPSCEFVCSFAFCTLVHILYKKKTTQSFHCTHSTHTQHTYMSIEFAFLYYSIWVGSNLYYLDSVCVSPIRSHNEASSCRFVNVIRLWYMWMLAWHEWAFSWIKNEKRKRVVIYANHSIWVHLLPIYAFWKFKKVL